MISQKELAEEERIRALHGLGMLDTAPEERFDRYTRLAARAFGVPVALVSLVDSERRWCKSCIGLDVAETPRPLAFCSHAVALDDMLVVPDMLLDERFAAHPHVTDGPRFRFYAGQPVYSLDGQPLGTLCILDRVARAFDADDRRMLRDLARMVEDELNRDAAAAARNAARDTLRELNADLERHAQERSGELAASHTRVAESEEWLRTIADNVPALIAYIDTGMRYRFANQRYQEWFGVASSAMLGKTVQEAMGEAFYAPRRAAIERCLAGHADCLEIEEERRGRRRVLSSTYLPHVRDGAVQGVYVLCTDATSAREYERQLHALAHSDHLTGLPNRRSYEERLAQAISRSRRSAMALAVAYLDVDRFKHINDTLGHAAGDAVLRELARRLRDAVRGGDTVARLAGDEFVVVLEQVRSPLECERIAAKLLDAIRPPVQVDGRLLSVTASIGIAWSHRPEQAALTQGADDALLRSKEGGRDAVTVVTVG
jgi:diguanylate cyclase (GGDEF)-like protein/PAS domain S-box-containing protein